MPRLAATTIAALAVALLVLMAPYRTAEASCEWSWCTDSGQATSADTPKSGQRWAITDTRRVRIGDLYAPAPGRRVQIRDNRRNIIGYIENDGTVTDTRRRKVGTIEALFQ